MKQQQVNPVPLAMIKKGVAAKVLELRGGKEFVRRLAEMGLLPGTRICVVKSGGPVILEIRDHRIVIGRGMADSIIVEPLS